MRIQENKHLNIHKSVAIQLHTHLLSPYLKCINFTHFNIIINKKIVYNWRKSINFASLDHDHSYDREPLEISILFKSKLYIFALKYQCNGFVVHNGYRALQILKSIGQISIKKLQWNLYSNSRMYVNFMIFIGGFVNDNGITIWLGYAFNYDLIYISFYWYLLKNF